MTGLSTRVVPVHRVIIGECFVDSDETAASELINSLKEVRAYVVSTHWPSANYAVDLCRNFQSNWLIWKSRRMRWKEGRWYVHSTASVHKLNRVDWSEIKTRIV